EGCQAAALDSLARADAASAAALDATAHGLSLRRASAGPRRHHRQRRLWSDWLARPSARDRLALGSVDACQRAGQHGCIGSGERARRALPGGGQGSGHARARQVGGRSEEHTSELQSRRDLVCRLLLEKKKKITTLVV